jgi:hypothetical protein
MLPVAGCPIFMITFKQKSPAFGKALTILIVIDTDSDETSGRNGLPTGRQAPSHKEY